MRRREFIGFLGAATAWPLAARAQHKKLRTIGFLNGQSQQSQVHLLPAFKSGLRQAGFVEGENVAIEYRWADNQSDRLTAMAAELVRMQVAVLVVSGGDVPAHVAKAATETIPIVTTMGDDPVKGGLVASVNRPGGNITGAILFPFDGLLSEKRIEFIRSLVPTSKIGLLLNPNVYGESAAKEAKIAASRLGIRLAVTFARSMPEIEKGFHALAKEDVGALIVSPDPFFTSQRQQLVALSNRQALPASYALREFVQAGGLMSYGSSRADMYRQLGMYAGRILNGAKPGDLPVQAPVKFELVINLKAAKALGLTVPDRLIALADEVIE